MSIQARSNLYLFCGGLSGAILTGFTFVPFGVFTYRLEDVRESLQQDILKLLKNGDYQFTTLTNRMDAVESRLESVESRLESIETSVKRMVKTLDPWRRASQVTSRSKKSS